MSQATQPQGETHSATITEELVEGFASVSGDTNPLHLDEEAAADGPFGERIAHGMLGASFISAALAKLDGEVIYLEQDLQFDAPVFIGDTLTAEIELEEVGDSSATLATTTVTNQDDDLVIDGTATILIQGGS